MPRVHSFIVSLCILLVLSSCANGKKKPELTSKTNSEASGQPRAQPIKEVNSEEKEDLKEKIDTEIPNQDQSPESEVKDIKPEEAAQPKKQAKKIKPAVRLYPQIEFDSVAHRLPEITEGDRFKHKFLFKNTGKAPLVIENVKASCGCTRPVFPFLEIAPGDRGEIGVTYDSYDKHGPQEAVLTVIANTKPQETKLTMTFIVNDKPAAKDSL